MRLSYHIEHPLVLLICAACFNSIACKPQADKNKSKVNADASPTSTAPRIDSYDQSDIVSIKFLSSDVAYSPWSEAVMRVSGAYPDGTEGQILEGAKWEIKSLPAGVIYDATNGHVASSGVTDALSVNVTFGKLSADGLVRFNHQNLGTPRDFAKVSKFEVQDKSHDTVTFIWGNPYQWLSGFRVGYEQIATIPSATPVAACPVKGAARVISEEILTPAARSHQISGLSPATNYRIVICGVQRIAIGSNSIERLSAWAEFSVTTNAAPSP